MSTIVVTPISTERLTLLPEHAGGMTSVLADPALYAFIGGPRRPRQEIRSATHARVGSSPAVGDACNQNVWMPVPGAVELRLSDEESATLRALSTPGRRWVLE